MRDGERRVAARSGKDPPVTRLKDDSERYPYRPACDLMKY